MVAVIALMATTDIAAAVDIRVLSVGSVQVASKILAADFERTTGHRIVFTIVSPDRIAERLANDPYDMLIASVPVVAALDKSGAIRAGTRAPLARAGIGVMIRDDAPTPDLSTPEAFNKTLLKAKSIAYGNPALPNQSGEVTVRILAKAGILEALKPKLRAAGLGPGLAMVANGEVEVALFNQVELPAGVRLAGPVPMPLQDYTFYEAAVLAKGNTPEAAQQFIRQMGDPAARKTWQAALLDAYPYR
jgi:molybdate transport system substrate-binding protein